jgi:hypothetical protein
MKVMKQLIEQYSSSLLSLSKQSFILVFIIDVRSILILIDYLLSLDLQVSHVSLLLRTQLHL